MATYALQLTSTLIFILLLSFNSCLSISTYDKDVTLTWPQKEVLDKYHELVADRLPHEYMRHEMWLIRWLRAKNYDVRAAETFMMKNVDWRRQNKIDDIHTEDWSDMTKDYKYYTESIDKEGQPMAYMDIGSYDIRKAVVQGKDSRLLRYVDKVMDDCARIVRALGDKHKNITRGHLILDFNGYNLVEHGCLRCVPVMLRMILSYENHYPLMLDNIMLTNVPSMAEPLLNAAKQLLSPGTRESLKIFGPNRERYIDHLLKLFYKNEIPTQLGGTKNYRGSLDDNYDY